MRLSFTPPHRVGVMDEQLLRLLPRIVKQMGQIIQKTSLVRVAAWTLAICAAFVASDLASIINAIKH